MDPRDEAAERLVRWHFEIEPGMQEVFRFLSPREASEDEPIKLVGVNTNTTATGQFDAFAFDPAGDIPYRTVLASVTPNEMEQIRQGRIQLPSGWDIRKTKRFVRNGKADAESH